MLETRSKYPFSLNRDREAPLLKEREAFLLHLQLQGTSRAALRNLSGELIHVVRLLRLQKLRDVRPEEIHKAAERQAFSDRPKSARGAANKARRATHDQAHDCDPSVASGSRHQYDPCLARTRVDRHHKHLRRHRSRNESQGTGNV
jgi:hypothetical protein